MLPQLKIYFHAADMLPAKGRILVRPEVVVVLLLTGKPGTAACLNVSISQ
jgi:hypothetical protein